MDKASFRKLLETALEEAARNAEHQLKRTVPRNFEISLFDPRSSAGALDVEETLDLLYLGDDLSYAIIDVSVVEVRPQSTAVFVRPSGYQPVPLERTWNYQAGTGPFKQLIAGKIKVTEEQS